jgi:hypothetical protein
MARRLTALVAPMLVVAGCASEPDDANPSPGDGGAADVAPDPNPFTPSAPLDAKYGSLSDDEAKNWCLELDAWLRREFDAAKTERYWQGSCLNLAEFEGRSFPDTFLGSCEASRASCIEERTSTSPAEDWRFPKCELAAKRKSCTDTPSIGELSRCATYKLRWRIEFTLSLSDRVCSDFVSKPLVREDPPLSTACQAVRRTCPLLWTVARFAWLAHGVSQSLYLHAYAHERAVTPSKTASCPHGRARM